MYTRRPLLLHFQQDTTIILMLQGDGRRTANLKAFADEQDLILTALSTLNFKLNSLNTPPLDPTPGAGLM